MLQDPHHVFRPVQVKVIAEFPAHFAHDRNIRARHRRALLDGLNGGKPEAFNIGGKQHHHGMLIQEPDRVVIHACQVEQGFLIPRMTVNALHQFRDIPALFPGKHHLNAHFVHTAVKGIQQQFMVLPWLYGAHCQHVRSGLGNLQGILMHFGSVKTAPGKVRTERNHRNLRVPAESEFLCDPEQFLPRIVRVHNNMVRILNGRGNIGRKAQDVVQA